MRHIEATLASPFASFRLPGGIVLMLLLLTTFAACSASSDTDARPRPATENMHLTSNPYAGETPAQRRAAWLKRQPPQQSSSPPPGVATSGT
jgi:hypothetical protein